MPKSPEAVLQHLCELLLPRTRKNAHRVLHRAALYSHRSVLELLETLAAFPWSLMLTGAGVTPWTTSGEAADISSRLHCLHLATVLNLGKHR